jgi:hypothetical protein
MLILLGLFNCAVTEPNPNQGSDGIWRTEHDSTGNQRYSQAMIHQVNTVLLLMLRLSKHDLRSVSSILGQDTR